MDITLNEMKACIQDWFSQALDYDDLREIYTAVRFEADKQFEYTAERITKTKNEK